MKENVLLFCVLVLSATLIYVSNTAMLFFEAATQVYCEKSENFIKCSHEFKEKTSELMRKK